MITSVFAVIATVAAVYVAVSSPREVANQALEEARRVEQQRRDEAKALALSREQQDEREIAMRYHEVASATYNSLDVVKDAIEAAQSNSVGALIQAAARSVAMAEALRILIAAPSLTDGPIISGAAAANALDSIANAGKALRATKYRMTPPSTDPQGPPILTVPGIRDHLESALVLAGEAQTRMDKVRNSRQIPVRKTRAFPVLPVAV